MPAWIWLNSPIVISASSVAGGETATAGASVAGAGVPASRPGSVDPAPVAAPMAMSTAVEPPTIHGQRRRRLGVGVGLETTVGGDRVAVMISLNGEAGARCFRR